MVASTAKLFLADGAEVAEAAVDEVAALEVRTWWPGSDPSVNLVRSVRDPSIAIGVDRNADARAWYRDKRRSVPAPDTKVARRQLVRIGADHPHRPNRANTVV